MGLSHDPLDQRDGNFDISSRYMYVSKVDEYLISITTKQRTL